MGPLSDRGQDASRCAATGQHDDTVTVRLGRGTGMPNNKQALAQEAPRAIHLLAIPRGYHRWLRFGPAYSGRGDIRMPPKTLSKPLVRCRGQLMA